MHLTWRAIWYQASIPSSGRLTSQGLIAQWINVHAADYVTIPSNWISRKVTRCSCCSPVAAIKQFPEEVMSLKEVPVMDLWHFCWFPVFMWGRVTSPHRSTQETLFTDVWIFVFPLKLANRNTLSVSCWEHQRCSITFILWVQLL